jgi:hypothetical protein
VSILRAEDKARKLTGNYQATGLAYSSTFKIEKVRFSEAFVNSYQTAHARRCSGHFEDLKYSKNNFFV